jgi:predicted transcriptional regulator
MTATTTLKLPEKLKARIARLAKKSGRSAHSLMVEALEREVARQERIREFVQEALAGEDTVARGAAVYRAEDVHAWLDRLARTGKAAARPKPRRK